MAELLDQFSNPIKEGTPLSQTFGMPSVIISEPFSLSNHDIFSLEKVRDEVIDKVKSWENDTSEFSKEYEEFANSWRIQPKSKNSSKPRGFANSKSGETHKATESLASIGFRMLTADDRFFHTVARGLDSNGNPISEEDLYTTESLLTEQLRELKFKKELLKCYRSLKLFGTVIFELNWERKMNVDGSTYFEGTSINLRPLIQTGFDTSVPDIDMSDYIFTVDYPSIWRLKQWSRVDPESWDRTQIEKSVSSTEYKIDGNSIKKGTNVWENIMYRRQVAGYNYSNPNVKELISYHGKIDVENPVIQSYWESLGRKDDPSNYDFTIGILDSDVVVKIHLTQYGSWRTKFKNVTHKQFELEPYGYGVGKLAQRTQRELDVFRSRSNDIVQMATYSMWKLSRFAGLKPNQMNIKPWAVLEMDDINQLEPLRPDINAVIQSIQLMAILTENIRGDTGATANLQAILTKASATESGIAQNEALRSVSVHAEIEAEVFIRETLKQMHINNLDNLDSEIWVYVTGKNKPKRVNRHNLPINVGFEVKTTTDKDFRPERLQKILEALQMSTSIRNVLPEGVNAVKPLFKEFFRSLGLDPSILGQPISMGDQLLNNLKVQQRLKQFPQLMMENQSEAQSELAGGGSNISTPLGPVAASPNSPMIG